MVIRGKIEELRGAVGDSLWPRKSLPHYGLENPFLLLADLPPRLRRRVNDVPNGLGMFGGTLQKNYRKSDQEDLTAQEIGVLRRLVQEEFG